jgi:hypothetical protein
MAAEKALKALFLETAFIARIHIDYFIKTVYKMTIL